MQICKSHFNPRSPRGERQVFVLILHPTPRFQSTLSARRATFFRRCFCPCCKNFNPRSPRGERRTNSFAAILCMVISIHALREESDFRVALHFAPWRLSISIHALREESDFPTCTPWVFPQYFNPRSPRGERLFYNLFSGCIRYFNPRSPRGERHCY